ncbi:MAG: S8 family serine peptidase, partial [Thermoplasmata archaeon]|nr:S8 family serine peptidase [Thermoplasmata archaeon]
DVSEVRSLLGLDGTGQIVAVADTGLDTGSNSTMHPDLSGRIIRAYAYGRTNNWSDPDIHINTSGVITYKGGHGTHVVGSVLGDGNASSGEYSGMAPNASLVMQSTMLSTGSLSIPAYFTLFNDAYNSGARIHTNSWSSRSNLGNYTSIKSWHIDNFVWGHSNMTILFSAGNKGPAQYTVSTQSSSKNVISVGASENYRPNLSSSANNISQMASFSSRGYVYNDGRVKPDVVAPGTYILSTRSSLIPDPWNHYWGWQSLYSTLNSRYAYNGGTSMSTPIVAGTAAVIRQYYQDMEDMEDPSAALIKASVINGARPLNGNWSSIPNRNEGWGLVNATNSICTEDSDAGVLRYIDNKTGLTTGSTHSRKYTISSNGPDAIITLVWSDYPGSNTSSIKLVNDMDMIVTGPDGAEYHGNDLSSPYNGSHDRINNVERIRIPDPAAGIYTVNITGYSVSSGPQPYAVVMTGDFTGAVASLSFMEGNISSSGGVATIELADSNLTGNGYQLVKVNSTTDPTGEMVNLTELVQGGESTGFFRGSAMVTTGVPGAGEVRVSSDENLIVHYQESYPSRVLTAITHVLLQPAIISITHDSEGRNLTYQDTVM